MQTNQTNQVQLPAINQASQIDIWTRYYDRYQFREKDALTTLGQQLFNRLLYNRLQIDQELQVNLHERTTPLTGYLVCNGMFEAVIKRDLLDFELFSQLIERYLAMTHNCYFEGFIVLDIWLDNGEWHFNQSFCYQSINGALWVANNTGQESIFDLATCEEIPV